MKKIAVLFVLISIISCKEKFNPKEFKGTWGNVYNDNIEWKYKPYITFRKDSIFFDDLYTYTIPAKYKIKDEFIKIYFENDSVKYKIDFNRKDSTLAIGDKNYDFYEGFSFNENFKSYKLIKLKREKNITADSLSRFELGFHLFKNNKNTTVLKLNDEITTEFNRIFEYTNFNLRMHFDLLGIVVYIGKGIELKDLIKLYKRISYLNRRKVFLITDFNLEQNLYGGFIDGFYFWDNQIETFENKHFKKPYLFEGNKKKFILKYNPKIIKINSKNDFEKINKIQKEKNYLISINPSLSIVEYINLKEKLFKIDRNIRTEFDI